MRLYFHSPSFDSQLLRVASYIYFGASDLGECLSTAARIHENDYDSWQMEWSKLAERLMSEGIESERKGHLISARDCFLKASNYYRTSLYFDYRPEKKERLKEGYDLHVQAFNKASSYFAHAAEPLKIPFEGFYLPGMFYSIDKSKEMRPLIICTGGYDSTHQEAYFSFVPAALQRGYNVISFDGPGQGELLIKKGLPMRPDWETVIRAVIDFASKRADLEPSKIALYGSSWGGFLAPRAACFEKRIACLIANPGQYDAMDNVRRALSQDNEGSCPEWEEFMQAAMKDKHFGNKIQTKMFIHGVETPNKLLQEWQNYSLKTIAENITCKTLVCDSENENLAPDQAKNLFDLLTCPKEYLLFKSSEGAGEHSGFGNLSLALHRIFDWLDTQYNKAQIMDEIDCEKQEIISLGYIK